MTTPDPHTRRWIVGFQFDEYVFRSSMMRREEAERVQDAIEGSLSTTAWLDDAGPIEAGEKASQ